MQYGGTRFVPHLVPGVREPTTQVCIFEVHEERLVKEVLLPEAGASHEQTCTRKTLDLTSRRIDASICAQVRLQTRLQASSQSMCKPCSHPATSSEVLQGKKTNEHHRQVG